MFGYSLDLYKSSVTMVKHTNQHDKNNFYLSLLKIVLVVSTCNTRTAMSVIGLKLYEKI